MLSQYIWSIYDHFSGRERTFTTKEEAYNLYSQDSNRYDLPIKHILCC